MRFVLPFPPSELSGHNSGTWRKSDRLIASLRAEACRLTKAAQRAATYVVPDKGDIFITFVFWPPNNMGDRTNYPIRIKPQIDGIAEALGINDRRFLPNYVFAEVCKPGRVEVTLL